LFKFIILLVLSGSLQATTFKPQPIEQQITEADGVFQGNYLKSKTIELDNGSLATQMIFKMTREVGLQSDFFGMDEVIVHYPGGKLRDKHVKVEGVPEFVPGEKVILFIRSIDNRYWGMNLGFGSYKVINYGNETVMINYIFPLHPQVGQVSLQHFEKLVKKIKGSNLKVVKTMQYPTAPDQVQVNRLPASEFEGQNRTVASKSEQLDNQEDQPNLNVFWLIIALGVIGGFFRMSNRRVYK
jgi:hypothetical protein